MQRRLTDRTLQALRPQAKRYEVTDVEAPGLGVRVSPQGTKTFVLIARYPGSRHPVRRTLGEYDLMSLAEARDEARRWRKLLKQGTDPAVERERQRDAEARRRADTFEAVAEAYFAFIKRQGLRRVHEVERDMRRDFVTRWAKRPITDIDWFDVKAVIDAAIKRGSPWQAHHVFSNAQRIFAWAREQGTYGLKTSPCDGRRPSKIIGPKQPRTRVLDDDEVRALWRASGRTSYPFGPLVRMLLLTGQRKSEVAEARWREFDLDKKLWSIPIARMKGKAAHVVPLTDDVIAILRSLPRFARGDYLFSTRFGASPTNGFSKYKARLDRRMLLSWRALGRIAGVDRNTLKPYVLHDIRRTMRTHLSALPVPDLVRELVIGHTKPGLHKVYDQHAYLDEKRHALELWAKRLRTIVEPTPDNVVTLRAKP